MTLTFMVDHSTSRGWCGHTCYQLTRHTVCKRSPTHVTHTRSMRSGFGSETNGLCSKAWVLHSDNSRKGRAFLVPKLQLWIVKTIDIDQYLCMACSSSVLCSRPRLQRLACLSSRQQQQRDKDLVYSHSLDDTAHAGKQALQTNATLC